MNTLAKSVRNAFRGSARTFRTFPAVMISAVLFVLVSALRIETGSDAPDLTYLLSCLQWALSLAAVFGLAAVTFVQTRFDTQRSFVAANLLGLLAAGVSFLLLYFFGGMTPEYADGLMLTSRAEARMSAAIFVSLLAFIVAAAQSPDSDFSRSFFMVHRAFFTALIYGLVIGGGTTAIVAAVQGLLYPDMSGNVYAYVGLLTGFLAFTIFVGYFPDFRQREDQRREQIQAQPRFVLILCEYILIPLMLVFTLVLLIWVVQILFVGELPAITVLSGSVTTYALVGIWLHIMVTHYPGRPAGLYRRLFPMALLLITAFAIWSLISRIASAGLTEDAYIFGMVLVFATVSAILLLIRQQRAHQPMAVLAAVLFIISVLPVVGAEDLPVRVQIGRLERILQREGILSGDELIPASSTPEESVRADITAAVDYLLWQDERQLPAWLEPELRDPESFEVRFGFPMTYEGEDMTDPELAYSLYLTTPVVSIDISDYDWSLEIDRERTKEETAGSVTSVVMGERGAYYAELVNDSQGTSALILYLDEAVILEVDLADYADRLVSKYPQGDRSVSEATFDDVSLLRETEEAAIWVLFESVNIYKTTETGELSYWFDISRVYLREN